MRAVAKRQLLLGGVTVLCWSLNACSDPYLRDGTWHATGVNSDNLRAMVANPADLKWGASAPGTEGQLAATAVARFRTGQLKPMSGDTISKLGSSGGGANAAPASPTPATGGN